MDTVANFFTYLAMLCLLYTGAASFAYFRAEFIAKQAFRPRSRSAALSKSVRLIRQSSNPTTFLSILSPVFPLFLLFFLSCFSLGPSSYLLLPCLYLIITPTTWQLTAFHFLFLLNHSKALLSFWLNADHYILLIIQLQFQVCLEWFFTFTICYS